MQTATGVGVTEGDSHVQQGSDSLDLGWLLGVARRRVPLIALCLVVVAAASHFYAKQQPKKYTATASIIFNENPLSQELVGLPANNGNLLVQQAGNVESVELGDMAAKTAARLGHGLTEASVKDNLKVTGLGESNSVSVAATASSARLAAQIANTYVGQFVAEQQTVNQQFFKSALALVHKQLAALTPKQRLSPNAVALENRAQSLSFLSELHAGEVRVEQEAVPPAGPSSPKTSKDTILGAIIGLLLGLGLAILLERIDRARRITDPRDLEGIYQLPLLGTVPTSAALSRSGRGRGQIHLGPEETERFNLIRAHLRSFNAERDPRIVLVASAALGDGRSTVACLLAQAAARLGSRVLLMEADLRHPMLAEQFDIRSQPYLPEVLLGNASMESATHSIALEAPSSGGLAHQTVDVLAAGLEPSPCPGALMESQVMEAVLEQARLTYDFVVLDTPAMAEASDAFPLLGKVDGVVVVGRIGSQRDNAERLREILEASKATLFGVIANRVRGPRGRTGGYSAGPARTGHAPTMAPESNGVSSPEELVSPPANV